MHGSRSTPPRSADCDGAEDSANLPGDPANDTRSASAADRRLVRHSRTKKAAGSTRTRAASHGAGIRKPLQDERSPRRPRRLRLDPHSRRARAAPRSWATSGRRSSRSNGRGRATTPATSPRPTCRGRTAGTAPRARTSRGPTATSGPSPSTSGTRRARRSPAGSSRGATSSRRTSRPGRSPSTALGTTTSRTSSRGSSTAR